MTSQHFRNRPHFQPITVGRATERNLQFFRLLNYNSLNFSLLAILVVVAKSCSWKTKIKFCIQFQGTTDIFFLFQYHYVLCILITSLHTQMIYLMYILSVCKLVVETARSSLALICLFSLSFLGSNDMFLFRQAAPSNMTAIIGQFHQPKYKQTNLRPFQLSIKLLKTWLCCLAWGATCLLAILLTGQIFCFSIHFKLDVLMFLLFQCFLLFLLS